MNMTKYPFENRKEFLEIREKLHNDNRLGGSEVGTAAGRNKYKSARRFYEELRGTIQAPDISTKQSIIDGILCEDLVAQKFATRTGKTVHRVNSVLTSDAAPHLFASIDRKVANEDAGLECKTANALNMDAFKDGRLPDAYVRQVKAYMKVTGYRTWYAYVWIMGIAEYCYMFTLDEVEKPEWCDTLVVVNEMELDECEETAARFMEGVRAGIPPEIDGSDDESDLLKELFPEATDLEPIALEKTTEDDLNQVEMAKAEIKRLEACIAERENIIREEMGSHAEATVGSRKITWKNNKPSAKTDWKAAATEAAIAQEIVDKYTVVKPGARVLRIGKAK